VPPDVKIYETPYVNQSRGDVNTMIGIDFLSFLVLFGISVVVAAAKIVISLTGTRRDPLEVFADLTVAWLGGWLGSPVFGFWFPALRYQEVFIVPALLGAAAAVVLKEWYIRHRGRAVGAS
jgi:hypothetical protein